MPQLLRWILFFSITTLLFASIHIYLYRRLVRDTTDNARLRRVGQWGLLVLALLPLITRFVGGAVAEPVRPFLTWVAWIWWGLALYLFAVALLGSSGVTLWRRLRQRASPPLVESPERRLFLSRAVAGSALAIGGGGVSYGSWRAFAPPEVVEHPLQLKGLPKSLDGLTIVHISDIHIGPILRRKFLDELVDRVNALKPDLVAITGDLVDGDVATLGPSVAALTRLQSRYGSYFCTGNHDYYSGDQEWSAALTGMGVQVLRNRRVEIGDAGGSLDLIGVDDWSAGRFTGTQGYDLDKAIAGRNLDRAAVLLAHQPAGFREAAKKGIGLQLSGHTHGGQMFPGTLLVRLVWDMPAGHYQSEEGSHIVVSRGSGFWGPPIRVASPPEIIKVVLTA